MNKIFFKKMIALILSFFCFSLLAKPLQSELSQTVTVEQKTEIQKDIEPVVSRTVLHKDGSNILHKDDSNVLHKDDSEDSKRFLELGLEYPINFGVHLRYLVAENIYARLGVGFMPSFFLDTFEELSPSFGYLNEEETRLLSKTFENSIYLDVRLAWSPYLKESGGGPYLELGLSGSLYGKGELTGSNLSKVITDTQFDESKTYSVKTNSLNAIAHIGYQIPLEKIKLNIEVGLIKVLSASILKEETLTAPELLNEEQEKSFKNFLEKKGWIFPTISGWVSFAF